VTQTDQILAHLKTGRPLDPLTALGEYGCFRLAARIYDLRNAEHDIATDIVETPNGARVARYWLKGAK
jgi:hypothetical protein